MLACLQAVVVAQRPTPGRVGSAELQCSVYALAYEFGLSVQPNMTAAQKLALSDALVPPLSNCTAPTSLQIVNNRPSPRPQLSRAAIADAPEFFVDAEHGSDANAGTVIAPLRTIAAAQTLSRTRASAKGATITLREGVYYLSATLALTALDSGLTLRSYAGELAEISGAAPLDAARLKWQPYDTSSTAPSMSLLQSMNLVAKATLGANNSDVDYAGKTRDAAACSALCFADASCDAFTWHDTAQPTGSTQWERMCYFVNRGKAFARNAQTHHVSGVKTRAEMRNVWVARGAVPSALRDADGLRVNGQRAIRARWPNGDPEYQLYPEGWVPLSAGVTYAAAAAREHAPEDVVVTSPNRSDEGPCSSVEGYCFYATGIGGFCAQAGYEPAAGYWCAAQPPRGAEYSTHWPAGLASPSLAARPSWTHWRANETIVNAFRAYHWFTFSWLVDQYEHDSKSGGTTLGWTEGGFQGGEGGGAAEWNVENVLDELDAPEEWCV
jgi:hypothetical protein